MYNSPRSTPSSSPVCPDLCFTKHLSPDLTDKQPVRTARMTLISDSVRTKMTGTALFLLELRPSRLRLTTLHLLLSATQASQPRQPPGSLPQEAAASPGVRVLRPHGASRAGQISEGVSGPPLTRKQMRQSSQGFVRGK